MKITPHFEQGRGGLTPFQLVSLGQQDVRWQGHLLRKGQHLLIKLSDLAPNVHDQEQTLKTLPRLEIVRYKVAPMVTLLVGHFRKSIAWQVDEALIALQAEEIDQLCAAWRFAGPRELPPIDDDVNRTRLAGIRPASDGDFRTRVRNELA